MTDARILCDISMGVCWPRALEELGAPNNERLRRHDGLHAKVYISDVGMVVGWPNATANGIGFNSQKPTLLEVGMFHEPNSQIWKDAVEWFEKLYARARQVDTDALAEARRRWRLPIRPDGLPSRPGSLLDLVRTDPTLFCPIGFEFVGIRSTKKIEEARQALNTQLDKRAQEIAMLTDEGVFTNWTPKDLDRWPPLFIEFWIHNGRRRDEEKLSVFGRQVRFYERTTGSVFSKKNWPALRSHFPASPPNAASIAQTDIAAVVRLLPEDGSALLYLSPRDLSKTLIQLQLTES